MNKERRKRLDEVMALVSEARGQLEEMARISMAPLLLAFFQ